MSAFWPRGKAKSPFAGVLLKAVLKPRAAAPRPAPVTTKAAKPDRPPGATDFAHLRRRPVAVAAATSFTHLLGGARARAAERAAHVPSDVTSPAMDAEARAEVNAAFILHSAAVARGEIVEPAARPKTDKDRQSQARADFIMTSAAMARGEIPIPRDEPQTAEDRRAQATADSWTASMEKWFPSRYGAK